MVTSLTLDVDLFHSARARAEAARVMAARPPIPKPRSVRRPAPRFGGPPVRGFVGELAWAVLMMLLLALGVRVMFVFATLQASPPPAVHVNEAITASRPATGGAAAAPRAQPSSEAAIRTM
jgi:hypothetical protein